MKLKVNWKELGKQLWAAVKPVLLAAIGGGIVSIAAGAEVTFEVNGVEHGGVLVQG